MLIARLIYPIETLGPGQRLVIWTVGCSKHCYNCANPELWEADESRNIDIESLVNKIKYICENYEVDGITITGGDPLEQKDEVLLLLNAIKPLVNDILVFSGFTLKEIDDTMTKEEFDLFKHAVSVLIDGPYVDDLNDNQRSLCGSTNQNIIFFDDSIIQKYEEYLKQGRKVQNVYSDDKIISVGIHNTDKNEE